MDDIGWCAGRDDSRYRGQYGIVINGRQSDRPESPGRLSANAHVTANETLETKRRFMLSPRYASRAAMPRSSVLRIRCAGTLSRRAAVVKALECSSRIRRWACGPQFVYLAIAGHHRLLGDRSRPRGSMAARKGRASNQPGFRTSGWLDAGVSFRHRRRESPSQLSGCYGWFGNEEIPDARGAD